MYDSNMVNIMVQIWTISVNATCVLEKNIYSDVFYWESYIIKG